MYDSDLVIPDAKYVSRLELTLLKKRACKQTAVQERVHPSKDQSLCVCNYTASDGCFPQFLIPRECLTYWLANFQSRNRLIQAEHDCTSPDLRVKFDTLLGAKVSLHIQDLVDRPFNLMKSRRSVNGCA